MGTVGAGRIGQRVLQRLAVSHHANPCKACDCLDTFCLAAGRLTLDCCRRTVIIFKACQMPVTVISTSSVAYVVSLPDIYTHVQIEFVNCLCICARLQQLLTVCV